MRTKKAFAGLLRGILAQYLKEAFVYLKNPKKISWLLSTVIVYARKNKKVVKTFLKDILLLWEMLNAWFKGEYKDIPKKTIVLIITALIYFISPIDLIPDWLPGGFIDDAALVTWVVQSISSDIQKFKIWKKKAKIVSLSLA
jgi:uncharacterized membrane protein YkvA (DUF1232 family)